MDIQIDPHTLERAIERGASEAEIRDVIDTGFPVPGKYGRLGKAKVYGLCLLNSPARKALVGTKPGDL
jgi:hypothetical protein